MTPLYSIKLNMNKVHQVLLFAALSLVVFVMPAAGQATVYAPGDVGNPFPNGLAETFSKPAFADFDGDTDLDFFSGSKDGTITYIENQAGTFVQQTGGNNPFDGIDLGVDSKVNVAAADLDGDGNPDVLAGTQDGNFSYYENDGAGGFEVAVSNPFGLSDIGNNAAPYFVDYDGDGDWDLVTGEFAGNISYFENTGDAMNPAFTERTGGANPFDGITVTETSQPAVGDLDGDSDHDLALGSSDGTLLYFENQSGTYVQMMGADSPFDGFTVTIDGGSGKGESGPAIVDVDGDTNNDVVVGDIAGDYSWIDANGPLPVELTSFEVVRNRGEIVLTWTTASELNNAGFEVQRRSTGSYETVGWVAGAGTTNEARTYTYTISRSQPGRHAFRLKQIDFNGAYSHSRAAEISIALNESFFMTDVYPNPFNPQATFNLTVARDQQVTVAVYDMQGRMISLLHSGELQAQQPYQFNLNGSDWASGKYMVRAVGEAFETTKMVTLLK